MALEVLVSLMIVGFVLLVKGADFFLDAAVRIAHRLGVSEFAIGVSIVGVGTSLPELAAALSALSHGHPAIAVGNVIGSNIANIGLVVGIAGLVRQINVQSEIVRTDALIMLFAMGVAYFLIYNRIISFLGGLLLLATFLAYLYFLFETKKELARKPEFTQFVKWFVEFRFLEALAESGYSIARFFGRDHHATSRLLIQDFLIAVISLWAVVWGANMLIDGAVGISMDLHIPENVIGLTLIAVGTSLPELTVSLSAVRRGMGNILLGNIIGSNIANVGLVLGLSAIAGTLYAAPADALYTSLYMLGIAGIFVYFMRMGRNITRLEASILLGAYVVFIGMLSFLCMSC